MCTRLHALLLELEAGGIGSKITVAKANTVLDRVELVDEATRYRVLIATESCDPHRSDLSASLPGEDRFYYDRKIAEGKSSKEAIRSLKRRISDRVYKHLIVDARLVTTN